MEVEIYNKCKIKLRQRIPRATWQRSAKLIMELITTRAVIAIDVKAVKII